jgi:hypothetical protein
MALFPRRHAMESGAATVVIVVVSRYAFTNVQTSPIRGEYAADAEIVSDRVSVAVAEAAPHDARTHVNAKK